MAKDDLRKTMERTESPVGHTSDRPPNSVDPEKLLAAWNSYHGTNLQLIQHFEEAREELKLNRLDNRRTRLVAILSAVIVTLAMALTLHRGGQVLRSSDRVVAIATKAGEQLTRVESTLATVVEAVALTNEAALEEAVQPSEPVAQELPAPRGRHAATELVQVPAQQAAPTEAVERRLAAQQRAVAVLGQLTKSPEAREAKERLVVLESAVEAMGRSPDAALP